jgi:hypothetical protein
VPTDLVRFSERHVHWRKTAAQRRVRGSIEHVPVGMRPPAANTMLKDALRVGAAKGGCLKSQREVTASGPMSKSSICHPSNLLWPAPRGRVVMWRLRVTETFAPIRYSPRHARYALVHVYSKLFSHPFSEDPHRFGRHTQHASLIPSDLTVVWMRPLPAAGG